jgi:hypothetical protein
VFCGVQVIPVPEQSPVTVHWTHPPDTHLGVPPWQTWHEAPQ